MNETNEASRVSNQTRKNLFHAGLFKGQQRRRGLWKAALLLMLCPVISCEGVEAGTSARVGETRYRMTFTSTWSAKTHPTNFPAAGAHFTTLVGAVHNDEVSIWKRGEKASKGMEKVAEFGQTTVLLAEIAELITAGSVRSKISGKGISTSSGSTQVDFELSSDYPLVTFASMLAPSPDWFVGVSSLSLLDDKGEWIERIERDVTLYDAGTQYGEMFELSGTGDSFGLGVITPLTTDPADTDFMDGKPSLGTFVFEKIP